MRSDLFPRSCGQERKLALYEWGLLEDEERGAFELHMIECALCRREYLAMLPVIEALKEKPQLVAPREDAPVASRRWRALAAALAGFAMLALIAFAINEYQENRITELAVLEPLPYIPTAVMRGGGPDEKSYREALELYRLGKYREAALRLERLDRTDTPEADLYLAISYLLAGDEDKGAHVLEGLVGQEQVPVQIKERARWYLANLYLRMREKDKALAELEWISRFGFSYRKRAEDLAARVRQSTWIR